MRSLTRFSIDLRRSGGRVGSSQRAAQQVGWGSAPGEATLLFSPYWGLGILASHLCCSVSLSDMCASLDILFTFM